jgi:hypothetical protein
MSEWASEQDQKVAHERARYLERSTQLDEKQSLTLACKELGYSDNGAAGALDSTKGTIRSRLDAVANIYGSDAVMPRMAVYAHSDAVGVDPNEDAFCVNAVDTDALDVHDLTPVSEQPTEGPLEAPHTGRKVVLEGDSRGPHTVERYFRTWTSNGRINRDAKVALSLENHGDDRTREHLSNLEWESHHCTFDPEYEFVSAVEDAGCWTFDTDTATLSAVREAVTLPPLDELPLVAETIPKREDCDPFTCTNPECSADRAHSSRDLDAYPRLSGPAIEVTQMSDFETVSYVCLECRAMFEPVPVGVIGDDEDGDEDDENENDTVLVEAMQ